MTVECRAMRPEEKASVLGLWTAVWGEGRRRFLEAYWDADPWSRPDYARVVVRDGEVLAALEICRRPMQLGGSERIGAGIANLTTRPDHRHEGLARMLIEDTVQFIHSQDFDFSFVFTEIQEIYARQGWQPVTMPVFMAPLPPLRVETEAGLQVEIIDYGGCPNEVQEIYGLFGPSMPMYLPRPEAYWTGWVWPRALEEHLCLLGRSGGHAVAYALVRRPREGSRTCRVHELGVTDERWMGPLLRAAVTAAAPPGATRLKVDLPNRPSFVVGLASLGPVTADDTDPIMIRPVHAGPQVMTALRRAIESGEGRFWYTDQA